MFRGREQELCVEVGASFRELVPSSHHLGSGEQTQTVRSFALQPSHHLQTCISSVLLCTAPLILNFRHCLA